MDNVETSGKARYRTKTNNATTTSSNTNNTEN